MTRGALLTFYRRGAEESANVVDQQFGFLHRSEVAAPGHQRPVREIRVGRCDGSRHMAEFIREHGNSDMRL